MPFMISFNNNSKTAEGPWRSVAAAACRRWEDGGRRGGGLAGRRSPEGGGGHFACVGKVLYPAMVALVACWWLGAQRQALRVYSKRSDERRRCMANGSVSVLWHGDRPLLGWCTALICPRLAANRAAEVGWGTLTPPIFPRAKRLSTFHASGRGGGFVPPLCLRRERGMGQASDHTAGMCHGTACQAVVCQGAHPVWEAPPLDSHRRGSATGRWGDANSPRDCAAGDGGSAWCHRIKKVTSRRERRRVDNIVPG